ncbi:hypothetical protein BS78_01G478400 [Paspalum vaginatum]|nr:hypothetical protein BS78_01G478400 [Paspalum vaginatum]
METKATDGLRRDGQVQDGEREESRAVLPRLPFFAPHPSFCLSFPPRRARLSSQENRPPINSHESTPRRHHCTHSQQRSLSASPLYKDQSSSSFLMEKDGALKPASEEAQAVAPGTALKMEEAPAATGTQPTWAQAHWASIKSKARGASEYAVLTTRKGISMFGEPKLGSWPWLVKGAAAKDDSQ